MHEQSPSNRAGHQQWSPQISPSQNQLCRSLLHEADADDIELLMPRSLDALLREVGEDYGQEADEDLYYFDEEYGCESDADSDAAMSGVECFNGEF